MAALILVFMVASNAALLKLKTNLTPLLLAILSIDIIASFVVAMMCGKSMPATVLFIANLLVSPWVLFSRLKKGLPSKTGSSRS